MELPNYDAWATTKPEPPDAARQEAAREKLGDAAWDAMARLAESYGLPCQSVHDLADRFRDAVLADYEGEP